MAISERELEENEVKLDNVLHKIVECSKKIQELKETMNLKMSAGYNEKMLENIDTLAKTIEHLAGFADILDIKDEDITRGLEEEIKDGLDDAIKRIIIARRLLQT